LPLPAAPGRIRSGPRLADRPLPPRAKSWMSHLVETLVQAVNDLYRLGVGKGQGVRPQPYDIAVPSVQLDVCHVWPPAPYIEKPPPIRQSSHEGAGVFLQAVVEIVSRGIGNSHDEESGKPVACNGRQGSLEQAHVRGKAPVWEASKRNRNWGDPVTGDIGLIRIGEFEVGVAAGGAGRQAARIIHLPIDRRWSWRVILDNRSTSVAPADQ
jgi:hypothetical protein